MGKIIAVANQKGGVGKTTTSVNLSACLGATGKKVLLVDFDPQGNASSGVGVESKRLKKTIYDVFIQSDAIDECLVQTKFKNLYLAPSNMNLSGAEIELVDMKDREFKLKTVLDACRDKFDYIFIDCPPSLGLLTINAFAASDTVLVPIQCEYYALEGLGQLANTIQMIKKSLRPELEWEGILLTMFNGRTNLCIQVVDEVKKHFKDKVYKTIIPRNVRLSEAPGYGEPILYFDKSSKGSKAYIELSEEFLKKNKKKRV